MPRLRLYFTCALAGLSADYRASMVAFRETLKERFEVLEFCDANVVGEEALYQHDIHVCVATADVMLAVVDERATGLGYELGTMIEKHGKPVLAVAQHGSLVSPLIRGITHPAFRFVRYSSLAEVHSELLCFARDYFPDRVEI